MFSEHSKVAFSKKRFINKMECYFVNVSENISNVFLEHILLSEYT